VTPPSIELYLDEDVNVLVGVLLLARGFSCLTTAQARNLGRQDYEQLEYAVKVRRCLLTHNRIDFEALAQEYFGADRHHFGIIIAVRRAPKEIVHRLLPILKSRTRDEIQNQLIYI
jgi:uncharacterized protein DUF5615